jgi:ribose transport system ATP-binding protein
MGENGAGKSTLIKILAGVVAPIAQRSPSTAKPVTIDRPNAAFACGLRFIHQELNDVPALSVAENIFLGRPYPRRLGALVDWRRLADEARTALARLGIGHIDPRRKMARLGVGDRMLVCICARSSTAPPDRPAST